MLKIYIYIYIYIFKGKNYYMKFRFTHGEILSTALPTQLFSRRTLFRLYLMSVQTVTPEVWSSQIWWIQLRCVLFSGRKDFNPNSWMKYLSLLILCISNIYARDWLIQATWWSHRNQLFFLRSYQTDANHDSWILLLQQCQITLSCLPWMGSM